MIDNWKIIKPLLTFPDPKDNYYFLQVLVRKKDRDSLPFKIGGSNNNSRLIRPYYISSVEYLENRIDEIKALCELFHGRAMINLNRRSWKGSTLQMNVQLAQSIQAQNYKNAQMWTNVAGKYTPVKDKTWIIDVDEEDMEDVFKIKKRINRCDPEGNKIIAAIPSRTGLHLITKPFNLNQFQRQHPNPLDIHKNNPTNLFIPKIKTKTNEQTIL
jgi:hypothetical protein